MKALWLACVACLSSALAAAQDYGATARTSVRQSPGGETLDAGRARNMPGALGEPARALSNLPGVARGAYDSGELVVWGSPGDETRTYVDGVEIPALFHPGGLRSTVHPALIAGVSLVPGAFEAAYGRGLGGVVELELVSLREPGSHGSIQVDPIDTSIDAQVKHGTLGVAGALRYGYLDHVIEAVAPTLTERTSVPSHADALGRLSVDLDARTRLSATWLGTRDRVVREVPSDLRASSDRRIIERSDQVGFVSLSRRYADGARVRMTVFAGHNRAREDSRFDQVPFFDRFAALRFGARASYARSVSRWNFALGLDVLAARSEVERSGELGLPAREGDLRVFGQRPGDQINADTWRASSTNVAPHASVGLRAGPLSLQLGLRLELYALSVNRSRPRTAGAPNLGRDDLALFPEPRGRVVFDLHERVRLQARAGIHHQPPAATDLSAVFGTPALGPSRALACAAGPELDLPHEITLRLEGYAKWLDDLAVRSPDPTPRVAEALVQTGAGHSYGGNLLVQSAAWEGMGFLASYALSRSTRTGARGEERLLDFDQTHVLNAIVSYARDAWLVSLRARYATGRPRTTVLGAYFDTKSNSYQPRFAGHNRARLPDFFQLDLHAEHTWKLGPIALALYADVLNLSNHANVEEVAYNADFSRRRDVRGLPFMALLGLRLGF